MEGTLIDFIQFSAPNEALWDVYEKYEEIR